MLSDERLGEIQKHIDGGVNADTDLDTMWLLLDEVRTLRNMLGLKFTALDEPVPVAEAVPTLWRSGGDELSVDVAFPQGLVRFTASDDSVTEVPQQMCKAYQASDQMICECGLQWDVNDIDPPECKGVDHTAAKAREQIRVCPECYVARDISITPDCPTCSGGDRAA